MSRFPRWLELEIAAIEHGDQPLAPPQPEGVAMEKTCSKCGKKLRKNTSFTTCTEHRTKEEIQEAWRRSAEQQRLKTGGKPRAAKPPPTSAPALDESWLKKFYRLHEALGLNPEAAIEEHCRGWVEKVTSRALAASEG